MKTSSDSLTIVLEPDEIEGLIVVSGCASMEQLAEWAKDELIEAAREELFRKEQEAEDSTIPVRIYPPTNGGESNAD